MSRLAEPVANVAGGFRLIFYDEAPHFIPRSVKRAPPDGLLTPPSPLPQDSNNIAPRIGIAITPASNWVIRAGYGIFFDRYVLAAINRVLEVNGTNASERLLNADQAALRFQAGLSPIDGVPPSIYTSAASLPTPYSQQTSVSAEHLFAKNWTASATYQLVRGVKLSRTTNVNLAPPVLLTMSNAATLGFANPQPQQLARDVF